MHDKLFGIIKSMKSKKSKASSQSVTLAHITFMTALVLLVPFIAMQFSNEVNWGLADFIIIGSLVFSTGLAYIFVTRKVSGSKQRAVVGLILAAVLLLVWAELAVGVFGSPISGS